MSETKRKILIIVVLLLVILFGVGQFFAGSSINPPATPSATSTGAATGATSGSSTAIQPAALPTQVISYVAMIPVSSTPVETGSCFATSIAAPYRADAYRCSVGNAINDPCFVLPTNGSSSKALPKLLCGVNPLNISATSTFVLQLTKALPKPEVPANIPSNWAWLVQLADGTICTPFTGTLPFDADGNVARYGCNGPQSESLVFNDLNNSSTIWTAEVGSLVTFSKNAPPIMGASTTVAISTVWQ